MDATAIVDKTDGRRESGRQSKDQRKGADRRMVAELKDVAATRASFARGSFSFGSILICASLRRCLKYSHAERRESLFRGTFKPEATRLVPGEALRISAQSSNKQQHCRQLHGLTEGEFPLRLQITYCFPNCRLFFHFCYPSPGPRSLWGPQSA